ncbi:MAG TPA: lysophospholipid acyltransferase family protein [Candidatus Polarisedimenticolia bacterium]|nr:lysophospholipid acyltransferase family protein [Candidatus Polarisedimenticolia bacterium]
MSRRQAFPAAALALFLVPHLAALWIRLTRATTRVVYKNRGILEDLRGQGRPFILAFWHGRLFLMPYAYPGSRIAILISEHRDGELISRTMRRFGFVTARGSSTRGGAAGLREILRRMKDGFDAAFTPDGPRGPGEIVQMGVIAAARLSGAPIVPVAYSCSKKNSSNRGTDF